MNTDSGYAFINHSKLEKIIMQLLHTLTLALNLILTTKY